MEAYFEALDGIPAWAVSDARLAALRGDGGCDPRFAPTPTQLALIARQKLQRVRDEISILTRLRDAAEGYQEPPSDEVDRVSKGFAELKAMLAPKREESPLKQFDAMCAEAGVDPDSIPDAPVKRGNLEPPRCGLAGKQP